MRVEVRTSSGTHRLSSVSLLPGGAHWTGRSGGARGSRGTHRPGVPTVTLRSRHGGGVRRGEQGAGMKTSPVSPPGQKTNSFFKQCVIRFRLSITLI